LSGGRLPVPFATLLQVVALPHAALFGWLIQLGETLSGLGLVAAGLVTLLRPLAEAHLRGRLWWLFAGVERQVTGLAPLAALGAGLLGLTFYLLDGTPGVWFIPSVAYGGALDTGLALSLGSLVLLLASTLEKRRTGWG